MVFSILHDTAWNGTPGLQQPTTREQKESCYSRLIILFYNKTREINSSAKSNFICYILLLLVCDCRLCWKSPSHSNLIPPNKQWVMLFILKLLWNRKGNNLWHEIACIHYRINFAIQFYPLQIYSCRHTCLIYFCCFCFEYFFFLA